VSVLRSPAAGVIAVSLLVAAVGSLSFAAGWFVRGESGLSGSLLDLEAGRGFTTLISPGVDDGTAIHQPTGRVVPFLGNNDMNVLDPTERFLFTSHETLQSAGVTRIDLETGDVVVLFQGAEYSHLDGLLWTPWDTLLVDEERAGGRLFEVLNPRADPADVHVVERAAFGTRKHEGLAVDARGYLYGVDEQSEGAIFRFVPDAPLTATALESGRLEVLVLLEDAGELEHGRVSAAWRPADEAATAGFNRPEDIEIVATTLYVAVTAEHRILSIDLADPDRPTVGEFVSRELHSGSFGWPDNLASDPAGNLYVAEDGASGLLGSPRDELWLARPQADPLAPAASLERFGTLRSTVDEPSGLLVDRAGDRLFLSVLGPNNSIVVVPLRP
jgi:sugar lactone lactonase YvrE